MEKKTPFQAYAVDDDETGKTVIMLECNPENGNIIQRRDRSFYIFGNTSIKQDDAIAIKDIFKNKHLQSEHHKGRIAHIGQRKPFIELESDSSEIDLFFKKLHSTTGTYGSWWEETFSHLKNELQGLSFIKVFVYFFTENPEKPPLEWKQENFEDWLAKHQKGLLPPDTPFEFIFISEKNNVDPFFTNIKNQELKIKTGGIMTLDEFITQAPSQKAEKNISDGVLTINVNVKHKNNEDIPTPKNLCEGWEVEYPFSRSEIDLVCEKFQTPSELTELKICEIPGCSSKDILVEVKLS